MDWRVYYDGGATFDSSQGSPFDAPAFGVAAIVERCPLHGRRLIAGGDFYTWRGDRWYSVNWFGVLDYLSIPGPQKILIGRLLPTDEFGAVIRRANEDAELPPRTAWGSDEVEWRGLAE